jgi:hydrogenase maturation protease
MTPGTLKIVRDEEVPKFTGAKKMSLHQTGFQEVLSAADLLGVYPRRLALIGCQPVDLEDWGGPLTPPVRDAIGPAVDAAVGVLAEWGVAVRLRAVPLPDDEGLLSNDIGHAAYERVSGGLSAQPVMAGAGPPSTPLPTAAPQGVDGGPAPAMTAFVVAIDSRGYR